MPIAMVLVVLLLLGAVLEAPGLLVVGLVLGLVEVLRRVWRQRGVAGVEYLRTLGSTSVVWGDEVPLRSNVWNRKILPIPWLSVDDHVSDGVVVRERPVQGTDLPGMSVIRSSWTLGPYERITREQHVVAERRGRFRFGPVRLEAADLFGGGTSVAERDLPEALLVAPRTLPVHAPRSRYRGPAGELAATGLVEDPARFAGLRPYQPGDPLRRIHWKAAARTGVVRSKRFDPSREQELVIALDIQTVPGRHWLKVFDEDAVEALCVAAASLARDAITSGGSCGLVAAAYSQTRLWQQRIAPARGPAQLQRLNETLARLSPYPSGPFEVLLASLPAWLRRPATVVSVSVRDPQPYAGSLRRLATHGLLVRHVALGPDVAAARATLGAVGVPVLTGTLDPDWRRSDALALAG